MYVVMPVAKNAPRYCVWHGQQKSTFETICYTDGKAQNRTQEPKSLFEQGFIFVSGCQNQFNFKLNYQSFLPFCFQDFISDRMINCLYMSCTKAPNFSFDHLRHWVVVYSILTVILTVHRL